MFSDLLDQTGAANESSHGCVVGPIPQSLPAREGEPRDGGKNGLFTINWRHNSRLFYSRFTWPRAFVTVARAGTDVRFGGNSA
jgi:hypothetical protein